MGISLKKKFTFHTLKPHTNQQYIPKHLIIFNSCLIELKICAFEAIVRPFELWAIGFSEGAEGSDEEEDSGP